MTLFLALAVAIVYPDATKELFVALYLLVLVGSFQLAINRELKRIGEKLRESSTALVYGIQDRMVAFREPVGLSKRSVCLERLEAFRTREARQGAEQMILFGLPRFFVETGVMFGLLGLIASQFS